MIRDSENGQLYDFDYNTNNGIIVITLINLILGFNKFKGVLMFTKYSVEKRFLYF